MARHSRGSYVTTQGTFKSIKLLGLAAPLMIWVLGPLVALAGNVDMGLNIGGLGVFAYVIAKVGRWWYHN